MLRRWLLAALVIATSVYAAAQDDGEDAGTLDSISIELENTESLIAALQTKAALLKALREGYVSGKRLSPAQARKLAMRLTTGGGGGGGGGKGGKGGGGGAGAGMLASFIGIGGNGGGGRSDDDDADAAGMSFEDFMPSRGLLASGGDAPLPAFTAVAVMAFRGRGGGRGRGRRGRVRLGGVQLLVAGDDAGHLRFFDHAGKCVLPRGGTAADACNGAPAYDTGHGVAVAGIAAAGNDLPFIAVRAGDGAVSLHNVTLFRDGLFIAGDRRALAAKRRADKAAQEAQDAEEAAAREAAAKEAEAAPAAKEQDADAAAVAVDVDGSATDEAAAGAAPDAPADAVLAAIKARKASKARRKDEVGLRLRVEFESTLLPACTDGGAERVGGDGGQGGAGFAPSRLWTYALRRTATVVVGGQDGGLRVYRRNGTLDATFRVAAADAGGLGCAGDGCGGGKAGAARTATGVPANAKPAGLGGGLARGRPVTAMAQNGPTLAFAQGGDVAFVSLSRRVLLPTTCEGTTARVTGLAYDRLAPSLLYAATDDGTVLVFHTRYRRPGAAGGVASPRCRLLHRIATRAHVAGGADGVRTVSRTPLLRMTGLH